MKKTILIIVLGVVILVTIVLLRTFSFTAPQFSNTLSPVSVKSDGSLLSQAISYETISHKREMRDDSVFLAFHSFLQKSFPKLHRQLTRELVNEHSLLYTWEGADLSKKPLILAAHMDVVPVDYASRNDWDVAPFSGEILEGNIYGRGTIDDKGSLIAIMESIENLINQGFKPDRTIILAFGHDEEIGGNEGAKAMAVILEKRGTRAWMVIDEGGTLANGIVPGIEGTVALIGTSEKGYVSLEVSADMAGGHSSMPEPMNALEAVNRAVHILKENPLPDRFSEPIQGFIDHIGPNLPFVQKMAFANTWLFKPVIYNTYNKSASGAALVHTTQVVTMFNSGLKDNVVPTRARAVVNYRLLPGDNPQDILSRAKDLINDTIVKVTVYDDFAVAASPISDHSSLEFEFLANAIIAVNPNAIVSPYLVLGATDGRYYYNITDKVFRFSPIPLEKEDLNRIHGVNERVSVKGYEKSVSFYATLIKNS
ncbi:acetylornithine deacetylase/succinyldiaminopimelate desuccinylase-like deacylase [Owenweeksia hongkongensis DSM 17368]|uniref:Acetylornithine deacetylase/succinyldiaminopimelate desuccinylase-like deacylase n=1 Tax=Owenweeksia hongkongensis (strain DSM 17368 / CIP 108786 / JCM 12287 / NRRL B-23963 / UST20020801) TaxID=926562 RepID=G8QZM1_OWEHD|nr:M20 family peptidase [Owenweeksia hongkongensis]AEV33674.1 acetylornithine deacetylase/succinyldiaminopimelate desuccinylase-like deacylase [Owenweeksia hongkongensis DSM 17368]